MIADDTPLLPEVVAYSVIQEARTFGVKFFDGAEKYLVERAERHYAQKGNLFRKSIRGNNGREWLSAFMRHWLAGWLLENGVNRSAIPNDWMNGKSLTANSFLIY